MLTARSSGGRAPADGAPPTAQIRSRAPRRDPASASSRPRDCLDPQLERLLHREPVVDLVPLRQPEHADDGGTVGRWYIPLQRHRAATVPARLGARGCPGGSADAAARRGRRASRQRRRWMTAVLGAVGPRAAGAENIGLEHAAGRVIAEPIFASRSAPAFDAAAMDGIAVAARATAERTGHSRRGRVFTRRHRRSDAPGTDAVVRREDVVVDAAERDDRARDRPLHARAPGGRGRRRRRPPAPGRRCSAPSTWRCSGPRGAPSPSGGGRSSPSCPRATSSCRSAPSPARTRSSRPTRCCSPRW